MTTTAPVTLQTCSRCRQKKEQNCFYGVKVGKVLKTCDRCRRSTPLDAERSRQYRADQKKKGKKTDARTAEQRREYMKNYNKTHRKQAKTASAKHATKVKNIKKLNASLQVELAPPKLVRAVTG